MLAVRVHRQGMGEAFAFRMPEAVQDGGTLALVSRQAVDADIRVARRLAAGPEGRSLPSVLPSITTQTGAQ